MIIRKQLENMFKQLPNSIQIYLTQQGLAPEQISVRAVGSSFGGRSEDFDYEDYEIIRKKFEKLCSSKKSQLNCDEYLRRATGV